MNDFSMFQSGLPFRSHSRSLGVKLIVVCGLALIMSIPTFFVWSLVEDRTKLASNVVQEISSYVGGQQTFLMLKEIIKDVVGENVPILSLNHGQFDEVVAKVEAAKK